MTRFDIALRRWPLAALAWALAATSGLFGCGAAAPPSRTRTVSSTGEVPGTFAPTVTPPGGLGEAPPPRTASERLIVEPAATASRAPCALVEGSFRCAAHFQIERVPRGARVFRVGAHLWEVQDGRGRRLALLEERPWSSEAMRPNGAGMSERSRGEVRRVTVAGWDGRRVALVLEQFSSERAVFRVERLATGTNWIGTGWLPVGDQ